MKKTKVKININENVNVIKDKLNKIKLDVKRIIDKIKTNIQENKGKSLTKQTVKYYLVLGLMTTVAVVSTYFNILKYQKTNTEDYVKHNLIEGNVPSNSTNVVLSSGEAKENTQDISNVDNGENTTNVTPTYKSDISSISTVVESVENSKHILPVSGKIVQEFSKDAVVYYESLGVWKTHPAIDIACSENAPVYSVLPGKVVGIYQDDIFGTSVVIEGEVYTAIYSSLDKKVLVSIGKIVEEGEKIGQASTNPAEQNHGIHLHFELMKDGEYVNPSLIGIKNS